MRKHVCSSLALVSLAIVLTACTTSIGKVKLGMDRSEALAAYGTKYPRKETFNENESRIFLEKGELLLIDGKVSEVVER